MTNEDHSLSIEEMTGQAASPTPEPAKFATKAEAEAADLLNTNPLEAGAQTAPGAVPVSSTTPAQASVMPQMPASPIAKPAASQLYQLSEASQAVAQARPALKINLSPKAHGPELSALTNETPEESLSWLGRLLHITYLDRIFTRRRLKYIGIALASFAVFAIVFNFQIISSQIQYALNPPKPAPSVTLPTKANLTAASQAEVVPPDNIIIIPKLNVNAPVVYEPSQQEKNIQTALQNGVVHYAGTAVPGELGNVAIVGHSSNDWWEPGNYKFVFALLDKLTPGDTVQINYSSHKYVYQVESSRIVQPTDLTVLAPSTDARLTLITCTPPGTSWRRLIVTAKQIEPIPSDQQAIQLAAATKDVKPAATLPGNAPSLNTQISQFFSRLFGVFNQKGSQSPSASPTPTSPHLPEVS